MKKIIVFMLCILVAASLFAASSFSGTSPDSSGNEPTQTVTFTIGDDMYSYNVGFSIYGNKASADIDATSLTLSESNKTKATNSSDLYIWWDIMTANAFDVTLSVSKPLTQTKVETGDPAEIDFTVDGAIQAGETKPDNHETKKISVSSDKAEDTDKQSITFLDVTDSQVANTYKGSQKLTIETKDGELAGKPEGTYESTLTLTVTDNAG